MCIRDRNKFVQKYQLSRKKFYVQYAGTMGTNFNPDIVLDVAQRLQDHSDIEFQMSIQSARMQVYFIDNDDYFQNRLQVTDENGEEYEDNDALSLIHI